MSSNLTAHLGGYSSIGRVLNLIFTHTSVLFSTVALNVSAIIALKGGHVLRVARNPCKVSVVGSIPTLSIEEKRFASRHAC